MARIQRDLSSVLGSIQRIRKLRSRVEQKARTEIQRGMQELDKEDDIVPVLDAQEHYLLDDARFLGVTDVTDLSSLGMDFDVSSLVPLFPDDTVSAEAGSSSNV